MKILVINSGSSSIKYQLFDTNRSKSLCRGIIDRIGSSKSFIKHTKAKKDPYSKNISVPDHHEARTQCV